MRKLFPHKIFPKGLSFGSFLPWNWGRSELPLTKQHSQEDVKEEVAEKNEVLFEERFAKCISVSCPKLGEKGCISYPGYEDVHWANGKRCIGAPFDPKSVQDEERMDHKKPGKPDVGYNFNRGKGRKKIIVQEPKPIVVKEVTQTEKKD